MEDKNFIKISYTGMIKDGDVFDTTDEKLARDEGIYNEDKIYELLPVVVGEGQVIKGLDDVLGGMKLKQEKEIEIPPEKAYGSRNPSLIKLVSRGVFKQKGMTPVPGMSLELDGRPARIQTVSGGRVRVDFNHELAGKTLLFKVKVEEKAKTDQERVKFLIERNFNFSKGFGVRVKKDGRIEISIPKEAYTDKNIVVRKASLSAEIFRYLEGDDVIYREIWENPKKKEK